MKLRNREPYFENKKDAYSFRIRMRANRLKRILFNAKIPIPLTIIETEMELIAEAIEGLKEAQRTIDGIDGEDAGYLIQVIPQDEVQYFLEQDSQ